MRPALTGQRIAEIIEAFLKRGSSDLGLGPGSAVLAHIPGRHIRYMGVVKTRLTKTALTGIWKVLVDKLLCFRTPCGFQGRGRYPRCIGTSQQCEMCKVPDRGLLVHGCTSPHGQKIFGSFLAAAFAPSLRNNDNFHFLKGLCFAYFLEDIAPLAFMQAVMIWW